MSHLGENVPRDIALAEAVEGGPGTEPFLVLSSNNRLVLTR
jgi:hypothetical protein